MKQTTPPKHLFTIPPLERLTLEAAPWEDGFYYEAFQNNLVLTLLILDGFFSFEATTLRIIFSPVGKRQSCCWGFYFEALFFFKYYKDVGTGLCLDHS